MRFSEEFLRWLQEGHLAIQKFLPLTPQDQGSKWLNPGQDKGNKWLNPGLPRKQPLKQLRVRAYMQHGQ